MSTKTDFQKVCDFNQAFDFPQYNNFSNSKCLKLRLDLIKEEIEELREAFYKNDYIEEMDACADILYVAYGMAYTYKLNSDDLLKKFITNNTKTLFQNMNINYINNISDINVTKSKILESIIDKSIILQNRCRINLPLEDCSILLHEIIIDVYKFQLICRYNSDKIFALVHDSNMTKLCKNEQEAINTVHKYTNDYILNNSPYDSPYYYQLESGAYSGYYIVKNQSTGKVLKSINYTPVQLNLSEYKFN